MKNFVLKRLQGLYNYYSRGSTSEIPYFKTMIVFLFLIFLHYLELVFLFNRFADFKLGLFPFASSIGRGLRMLIILLCCLPVYVLINWIFPERVVVASTYSEDRLAKYRNQFFFYAGFLLVVIIVTIWPFIKFS